MKDKKEIVKKYIRQKEEIREHLRNGGDIDDLDKEEYGFKKPI